LRRPLGQKKRGGEIGKEPPFQFHRVYVYESQIVLGSDVNGVVDQDVKPSPSFHHGVHRWGECLSVKKIEAHDMEAPPTLGNRRRSTFKTPANVTEHLLLSDRPCRDRHGETDLRQGDGDSSSNSPAGSRD
jgi:hypothetical protein